MNLSVLVIEGDWAVAGLFVEVFSQQGWEVCTSGDVSSVNRTLLGDRRFDIITVSYRFLTTNGLAITRRIREIEHRKDTPVLLVTGGPDVTGEALAAGVNEVLYKPIEPCRLVAAVIRHSSALIA